MSSFEDDFGPDADGLRDAVERLLGVRRRPGSPHVDPAVELDLVGEWPASEWVGALRWSSSRARHWSTRADSITRGLFAH